MDQRTSILGIIGMICGILAIFLTLFIWPLGLLLAIGGLILSLIGMKRDNLRGYAIAGLMCSGTAFMIFAIGALFLYVIIPTTISSL